MTQVPSTSGLSFPGAKVHLMTDPWLIESARRIVDRVLSSGHLIKSATRSGLP
jgi:hypothetical protein